MLLSLTDIFQTELHPLPPEGAELTVPSWVPGEGAGWEGGCRALRTNAELRTDLPGNSVFLGASLSCSFGHPLAFSWFLS
jgi:hypothetical protein